MRGFTLLEVMIALAIAAGVLLTVISSLNYHLAIVGQDREETVAALAGRAKLEDPDFPKVTDNKGTFAPDHPELSWERQITPTEIPGINRVLLTVSWQNGTKRLSLVQYASK